VQTRCKGERLGAYRARAVAATLVVWYLDPVPPASAGSGPQTSWGPVEEAEKMLLLPARYYAFSNRDKVATTYHKHPTSNNMAMSGVRWWSKSRVCSSLWGQTGYMRYGRPVRRLPLVRSTYWL